MTSYSLGKVIELIYTACQSPGRQFNRGLICDLNPHLYPDDMPLRFLNVTQAGSLEPARM